MLGMEQLAGVAPNIAWIAAFSVLMWVFGYCAVWVYFHETDASRRQAPRIYSTLRLVCVLLFIVILAVHLAYR